MLNAGTVVTDDVLKVIEGVELHGQINVSDDHLLANVRSAIRRPYPQVRRDAVKRDRICLVGSGPSLADTEQALVDLLFAGRTKAGQPATRLVTVNGAYHWCLERHLQPSIQIVMDARATNARFLEPAIPNCTYLLASQCAPETWDAVEGRPDVWMFHAANAMEGALRELLDAHFLGQWQPIGGGTTVGTRAIMLLRILGYLTFDLFGMDSCWLGDVHHAMDQPENAHDARMPFQIHPSGEPEKARTFWCSPWHVKQAEDFLQLIRINGDAFQLQVHGDGLLAYILSIGADCVLEDSRKGA